MKLISNLTFDNAIQQYEEKYNRKYYHGQLRELREGFEKGLDIDVSVYAHTGYSAYLMQMACSCLIAGVPVHKLTTKSGKLSAIKVSQKYTFLTNEQRLSPYNLNN